MIKKKLIKNAKKVDKFLINYIKKQNNSLLVKPMKYGVISGGKKIRSTIIFDLGKIFNLSEKKLINICAAVECIHSYSLIHDDLPCMDNDKMRRGKPSTHIKFGEASAVLAGSSLLTLAFEIIAEEKYELNSKMKNEIIKFLASCSGHTGIAGGQELDLKFENKNKKINQIIDMQKKKTGKLFNFCLYAVGVIANKNKKEKKSLSNLGEEIGSVNININIDQISKNYEKEIECPICFDTTTDNKITHCNHTFCKKCLENWIINYNKCPICMLELKKIN